MVYCIRYKRYMFTTLINMVTSVVQILSASFTMLVGEVSRVDNGYLSRQPFFGGDKSLRAASFRVGTSNIEARNTETDKKRRAQLRVNLSYQNLSFSILFRSRRFTYIKAIIRITTDEIIIERIEGINGRSFLPKRKRK